MLERNHSSFFTFILPLTIFPLLLATSIKYLFLDHLNAGLGESINTLCLPSPSNTLCLPSNALSNPYRRTYTSIPLIDALVPGPCAVVAFFHLLLDSDAPTPVPGRFLVYLLGTGLPFVLVPLVGAYRWTGQGKGKGKGEKDGLVGWPTVWLLMTQGATMALTFPVYFLVVVLSSRGNIDVRVKDDKSTRSKEDETKPPSDLALANCMTPEETNALVFGLAFGAVLPSLAMIYLNDALATWVWQFYPLLIFGLRHSYLCFAFRRSMTSLSPSSNATSTQTRRTLRILYLTCFALSSLTHARLIWPLIYHNDITTLKDLLVPLPVSALLRQSRSAAAHLDSKPSTLVLVDGSALAHNFLKWDYCLGACAVLLGLLCSSAGNWRQLRWMVVWYALAIPVLGAGAACMGVLAWRDLM